MRKLIIISVFLILSIGVNAQPKVNFGISPTTFNDDNPVLTSDWLETLNWDSIKNYCRENNTYLKQSFGVYPDRLKTVYTYIDFSVGNFKVVCYNGFVLEYHSEKKETSKTSYFDKNVWMQYVHDELPFLPDSLKISIDNPIEILKAYYQLLGVDVRKEYGWICEYSTVGMPPDQRKSILKILAYTDLLRKLIDYPDIQVQMYVVDALIYLDYLGKKQIKELEESTEYQTEMKEVYEEWLLRKEDWQKIYAIRDSGKTVITCIDGTGSFRVYETNVSDLLSKKAISEIPTKYEALKKLGY